MQIEAFFDPICPWCYIGKRRLAHALQMRPGINATISWRPFLLNPDMPLGGMERRSYLLDKFGSEARVRRLLGALEEYGQSEQIEFRFDDIGQTPSTIDAHRLVYYANRHGKSDRVVELLFEAFFKSGLDIGSFDVLKQIGIDAGLDAGDVEGALNGGVESSVIMDENSRAHRLGINGVPCYIIDGRFALQGAQPPKVMLRLLDSASVTV